MTKKNYSFEKVNTIGRAEIKAALKVLKSGVLSDFLASPSGNMFGGKKVIEFENAIKKKFGVKYALTFNSWTSGLIAAVGATDINPGDEVICTPWTMSATAISILHWSAIPVFADIDPLTYNLDIASVKKLINKRTKAIISVDIFGRSAQQDELYKLAKKKNIILISDTAQAPGSKHNGYFSSTKCHMGGFSLNYHKHINTGEGGILITNYKKHYLKAAFIRNHAEVLVKKNIKKKNLVNMVGYNFRMNEIEAAIGIEQLKKLNKILKKRIKVAKKIISEIGNLYGLTTVKLSEIKNYSNVFYLLPFQIDFKKIKSSRKTIIKHLREEGMPGLIEGYSNVHRLPIFQKKIAHGNKGHPWNLSKVHFDYSKGICPNAEFLHDKSFFGFLLCLFELKDEDIKILTRTFKEVWNQKVKKI
tara:strand:- start:18384 stop:19634 length:1251 start_codon:yes stop_codon:yes gene_type:complete